MAAAATPRAFAALCRPAVGSSTGTAPLERVEAVDLEGRGLRRRRGNPAEHGRRRTDRGPELAGHAPAEAREALGRRVDEGRGDDLPRPVAQAGRELGDSVVGDVGDERGRRDRAVRRAAQPGVEGRDHGGPIGEDVGMVPLGRRHDRDRGPVRVEVAGVLVGLDHEGRSTPPPSGRADAAGELGRQQRADERRRVTPRPRPGRGPASRPTCSCRGCPRRR